MARGLKYTVPFASLDNTQYVANVYVEGYTGDPITMDASDVPFETEELKDHKWLTVPVRTQTGYLRVVCEESEWRGLIPSSATSHYVELKKGNDVMWFGFIKPENFTHALYAGTDVYEFPLQCPLSVLDGMKLEWDDTQSIDTFSSLLHRLLSLVGVNFSNCWFTNNLSNLFDDLLASANLIQYFEDATRMVNSDVQAGVKIEEHYLTPSATALEILQAVCQFWGWECHLWGTDIYFTAHDEHTGYRKIPFADLNTLTTSYQMRITAAGHVSVEDADYMTDQHQVEVALPARDVSVKTDINAVEKIMDINIDDVAQFSEIPLSWHYSPDSGQTRILAKCDPYRIEYDPAIKIPGMTVKYEGEQGLDEAIANAMDQANKGDFYGTVFQKTADFPRDTNPIPTKYDLSTSIFMLPTTGASIGETAKLTFETLAEYDFDNCAITIHGDVFSYIAMSYNSPGARLAFHVSIGDYYFSAISPSLVGGWVNYDAIAAVPIGLNNDFTEESQNLTIMNITPENMATEIRTRWDTPYQGAEGYVIPVTQHLRGKLKISIEWQQDYYQNVISASSPNYLRLSNFGVTIVRASSGAYTNRKRTSSSEYKESITTDSSEKVGVNLRYATDNYNQYGTAFVFTKDGGFMGDMSYRNGDSERPEEHLLNRLVNLYSKPTEWREIDVNDNEQDYTGAVFALLDEDGNYWAPIAVARNWVDNIARLTIGKIGQWTPPARYYLVDCFNTRICDVNGNPFTVVGS